MTKLFFTCFFYLILSLQCNAEIPTEVTVYPNDQRQTIKGWGTSLSWWANYAGYWNDISLNWVADKATNDLNMNVFRFNVGGGENPNCPFNATCISGVEHFGVSKEMPGYRVPNGAFGTYYLQNDARQIRVMDKLEYYRRSNNDIITEISSCSPPWWMTNSKCTAGGASGADNLKTTYNEAFADYLASVTTGLNYYHPKWNIKYIEPFNEPLSTWWEPLANVVRNSSGYITLGKDQEGCQIKAPQQADVLWWLYKKKTTVYPTISHIGLVASDCNKVKEALDNSAYMYANDRATYDGLSKINTHTYSGTIAEKDQLHQNITENTGKPIWQSETGPLYIPALSYYWDTHYFMAKRQIEDLRHLQCEVWCDWQLVSGGDAWGLFSLKSTPDSNPNPVVVPTRGFYCRKQVNYFIKQGYTIVNTNNENTIAAINPAHTQVIFVVVNYSKGQVYYKLDLTKFKAITSFRTWRTSGGYESTNENCEEKTAITINEKGTFGGNQIWYMAPAFSVTTFVAFTTGIAAPQNVKKSSGNVSNTSQDLSINESNLVINSIQGSATMSWKGIQDAKVQIFDMKGQLVYENSATNQDNFTINTGSLLMNAVYVAKIIGSNTSFTKKFIVR